MRLQITTELLRLETGHPGRFTDVPYDLMHQCATPSWIKSLWETCHKMNISIAEPFGDLQLARERDQFLMPLFIANGCAPNKDGKDLLHLQAC